MRTYPDWRHGSTWVDTAIGCLYIINCNYADGHARVSPLSSHNDIYYRLQDSKVVGMRKTPKIAIAIMIAALSSCTAEPFDTESLASTSPLNRELSALGQAAAKACLIQFMDVASVEKASGVLIAAGYELNEKQWEGMRGFTKPLSAEGKSIWGDSKGHTEAAIPLKTDLGGRLHCRASVRGFNSKARGDVFYRAFAKEIASSATANDTRVYGRYENGAGSVGALYSPKKSSR